MDSDDAVRWERRRTAARALTEMEIEDLPDPEELCRQLDNKYDHSHLPEPDPDPLSGWPHPKRERGEV